MYIQDATLDMGYSDDTVGNLNIISNLYIEGSSTVQQYCDPTKTVQIGEITVGNLGSGTLHIGDEGDSNETTYDLAGGSGLAGTGEWTVFYAASRGGGFVYYSLPQRPGRSGTGWNTSGIRTWNLQGHTI